MSNLKFSYSTLRIRKHKTKKHFHHVDYLAKIMEKTLYQRLLNLGSIKNNSHILLIGCPSLHMHNQLQSYQTLHFTHYDPLTDDDFNNAILPSAKQKFDIIIDSFIFHWINDPIKYLHSLQEKLNKGGCYLLNFLGGKTLQELRNTMLQLDMDIFHGGLQRISPMIKAESTAKLLQTCQFKDTVIDQEEIKVEYKNVMQLINDLRNMGESNCLSTYQYKFHKQYVTKLEKMYKNNFYNCLTHHVYATFNIINAIGWK